MSDTPKEGTVVTKTHPDGRVDANVFAVPAKGVSKPTPFSGPEPAKNAEPPKDEKSEK